jgi:hypothetical protein
MLKPWMMSCSWKKSVTNRRIANGDLGVRIVAMVVTVIGNLVRDRIELA